MSTTGKMRTAYPLNHKKYQNVILVIGKERLGGKP
jgi:hypothetical protein